jgi:hypothetical protein
MSKKVCLFVLVALCCWAAVAHGPDIVTMPAGTLRAAEPQPILDTAGYWTLDYLTGEIREGTSSRAELVYDNTTNSTGFGYEDPYDPNMCPPVPSLGDGLWMAGDGLLDSVSFSIFNESTSAGSLTRVDVQIDFSDVYYQVIGSVFLDDVAFDPPIAPGAAGYVTVENLGSLNIDLPYTCLCMIAFCDLQGGADRLGQAFYDPPTIGESGDAFCDFPFAPYGGWFYHSGNPVANFYCAVGVERSPTVTLYDMGAQHLIHRVSDNTDYWLGFTSGYYDATTPQRWAAIPFYIDQPGAVITEIQANWFIVEDPPCQADSVVALIWHRNGLDAPTSFDELFWEGVIGPYEAGAEDYRAGGGFSTLVRVDGWDPYHTYDVNIPIPVGDYYLTLYADGGDTPNALAWLSGGHLQDEALEQGFMWRSSMFPTPGFQVYDNPDLQPGAGMLEYDDVWNCTFMLRGTVPGCVGDVDGDGDTDLADLAALLGAYNTSIGDPNYNPNADFDESGTIDLADLAHLLGDYGCGS